MHHHILNVLENIPPDWQNLTTHRLDVYNEELAKTEFLEQFEALLDAGSFDEAKLSALPTAFDYIRLGHPLSCVLEWAVAKINNIKPAQVISFSSRMMGILAVLRKNLLDKKFTHIIYQGELPSFFDAEVLKSIYGYSFELTPLDKVAPGSEFEGSTILVSQELKDYNFYLNPNIDFLVSIDAQRGSIIAVNGEHNEDYISEIQHVRRRESIAMTPADCLAALWTLVKQPYRNEETNLTESDKIRLFNLIRKITDTPIIPHVGSSGLSIQYAIMMGLIHDARESHPGKAIRFAIPPNCYGGTNDQARRVAACIDDVEIVDLPVDGENDMVSSMEVVLEQIAQEDAVPYIIAEIPTNPRVEVPDLTKLEATLNKKRTTQTGGRAVEPVFILDQTFCPNVQFIGEGGILTSTRTISYVSGSKFPSGGKCTAGYCVANYSADTLMEKIGLHLQLCDNEATNLQYEILGQQMPSMIQRIREAFLNTYEFVNFITHALPKAKINFVSDELARQDFTPSVFSLDLPTKGATEEEKEAYKRAENLRLINLMISEIPQESKHCVSYGQLQGCYWTIPATSTQGTTKEGDKDYIVRAALSPDMDLERHKEVFMKFIREAVD